LQKNLDELLINKKGGRKDNHTWIHPRLATHLAQWISSDFAVKVSGWIEEWKKREDNQKKYIESFEQIKSNPREDIESVISNRIAKEINGEREVETRFGKIDVLSDIWLIEVKNIKKWHNGIGQILIYSEDYPEKRKRLHLFGQTIKNINDIEMICNKYGIEVTFEC
jgi:hypothetical protein